MANDAVVLGGGVAGIPWETGMMHGIQDAAPDLSESAGRFDHPHRDVGRFRGRRAARPRHPAIGPLRSTDRRRHRRAVR
ncbi:MAG: hypothetical protein M3Y77_19475 [Actinomycetota bacterium]|nr:hypothetical protein [Actinomycetota bacterium]